MDFSPTPEQDQRRATIVAFARATLNQNVIDRDRDGTFSRELWRACAAMGLAGLPVERKYGGQELDPLSCAHALEALGYGCTDHGLVFGVCAHVVSCVVPLSKFGTPEQKRRYLSALCDGRVVGAHAITEAGSGSDAFGMQTTATKDGGGWRITGQKAFVSNHCEAGVLIVFAVTDAAARFHGGVTAFLVDKDAPGLTIGATVEKMGLRTTPFGSISLDEVRVGNEQVLGGVGGGTGVFAHSMDWERACLFAAHVGQMERLTERAAAHARQRQTGGVAIGKHQAVSHKIADMKVRLEAARLLVYRAASGLDRRRAVALDAAVAKLFVSEALVQTASDLVQILGGAGYATGSEAERALRDAFGSKIYSGTSEIQRNIIAGWLDL